eukprot:Sdes_comp14364_c0_seq1m3463
MNRPEVTGVSPKYGPASGGTKVTVRGQNLGLDELDVVFVTIAGHDCHDLFVYESSSKLTITTPPGTGRGPIIVTTESGGEGVCEVQFSYEEVQEVDSREKPKEVDIFTE